MTLPQATEETVPAQTGLMIPDATGTLRPLVLDGPHVNATNEHGNAVEACGHVIKDANGREKIVVHYTREYMRGMLPSDNGTLLDADAWTMGERATEAALPRMEPLAGIAFARTLLAYYEGEAAKSLPYPEGATGPLTLG